MSSAFDLILVYAFFFVAASASSWEETVLTREATITTRIGASRVASTHTRRSAPVPAHVMVPALSDASLLLHTWTAVAVKNLTAPTQVYASSTDDVASAETKTALRITPFHVDTIDIYMTPHGVTVLLCHSSDCFEITRDG